MSDRTVHAHLNDTKIVRDSGHWYVEDYEQRDQVTVMEAALLAVELRERGGAVHFDIVGGSAFDREVARLLEGDDE